MKNEPGTARNASSAANASLDAIIPRIYEELRRLAASYMRQEREGHTLQPTALVNETYMRLAKQHSVDFANRAQVLGVAAQMMRRILATHAERRDAGKRGGDVTRICLSDAPEVVAERAPVFGEVDQALDRLAALDERQAKVVELRIFGGLSVEETAEFLKVSVATVHRDWASGRLWLARELRPSNEPKK
ncbi:MAG: ECF-type sigma factor [Acidobacteriota bacterium]